MKNPNAVATMKQDRNEIKALAESWVDTDPDAIRKDVAQLGGVTEAADYSADMAVGQPHWEALSSREGRRALRVAIRDVAQ